MAGEPWVDLQSMLSLILHRLYASMFMRRISPNGIMVIEFPADRMLWQPEASMQEWFRYRQ